MSLSEFILALAAVVCAELYWYERKRRQRAELKALPYRDAANMGIFKETLDSWDEQMRRR